MLLCPPCTSYPTSLPIQLPSVCLYKFSLSQDPPPLHPTNSSLEPSTVTCKPHPFSSL